MRLKTFQAETMADAMQQIRQELGDDAVIVATHRSRRGRGVEITAAIEPVPIESAGARNNVAAEPGLDAHSDLAPKSSGMLGAERLGRALAFHGVPPELAERLCLAAARRTPGDPAGNLAVALDASFGFQPIAVAPSRPVLLAGPPGSGKTVTTAKLAARAVMAGFAVTVISCDTVRAGGLEQLAAFIDLLRQPLIAVDDPQDLAKAVARTRANGPVFIDTPGTNPYNAVEFDDLKACIAASGAEPILVTPAGADASEAAEAAASFALAGIAKLLPTRLDVARRYGSTLSAADAAALALVGASTTAFVAKGLRSLSPLSLARLLLRDPSGAGLEAEFDEAAA
jgi:flagellar biosynthesis protein FlhF